MDLVSPLPFWLHNNGLISAYPSLQHDVRCDVVILGAGISGAFAAESLTRAGMNVVVIDKRDVASGSTCASTALLSYEIDTHLTDLISQIGRHDAERAYRASHDSIDAIARLVDELRIDCGFERRPCTYLAVKKREAAELRNECAARRTAGFAVEYLDAGDVASRFSFSRPAALVSAQGGQLDAHKLGHALLAHAVKRGARIFDRTCVEKIEPQNNGVRLETEGGCAVHARQAVFATGYESQEFLPHRVLRLKSTYALASEHLVSFPGWWERCLIWETSRPYLYLRTTHDGRALVGGEDDDFHNPDRRDRLVQKRTDSLAAQFREMFPDIPLKVDYRWAGTFGETKDGLAYVGSVRQMPNCHFILGFGGNGITYSWIAAQIVREALSGRTHPDAHLFRFDR
jgi:glycine/D-amino acid oxidase-like deaminating enzyme